MDCFSEIGFHVTLILSTTNVMCSGSRKDLTDDPPRWNYYLSTKTCIRQVMRSPTYVDKTKHALEMIKNHRYVFISRPALFGKTLFLNTLYSIFNSESDLFANTYIGNPRNGYKWVKHPILKITIEVSNYGSLKDWLVEEYGNIAKIHNLTLDHSEKGDGLRSLLMGLYEKNFRQEIVVLIDDYDYQFLHSIVLRKENLNTLRDMLFILKTYPEYLRFVYLTGTTKLILALIPEVSNNFYDLSLDERTATLFGFTRDEIRQHFSKRISYIARTSKKRLNKTMTASDVEDEIMKLFHGYKFSGQGPHVCNPKSVLYYLNAMEYEYDPFCYRMHPNTVMNQQEDNRFERMANKLDTFTATATQFELQYVRNFDSIEAIEYTHIMFISGILTIKSYDASTLLYTLEIACQEVKDCIKDDLKEYEDTESSNFLQRIFQKVKKNFR